MGQLPELKFIENRSLSVDLVDFNQSLEENYLFEPVQATEWGLVDRVSPRDKMFDLWRPEGHSILIPESTERSRFSITSIGQNPPRSWRKKRTTACPKSLCSMSKERSPTGGMTTVFRWEGRNCRQNSGDQTGLPIQGFGCSRKQSWW